jgi:hypothetical protein
LKNAEIEKKNGMKQTKEKVKKGKTVEVKAKVDKWNANS